MACFLTFIMYFSIFNKTTKHSNVNSFIFAADNNNKITFVNHASPNTTTQLTTIQYHRFSNTTNYGVTDTVKDTVAEQHNSHNNILQSRMNGDRKNDLVSMIVGPHKTQKHNQMKKIITLHI